MASSAGLAAALLLLAVCLSSPGSAAAGQDDFARIRDDDNGHDYNNDFNRSPGGIAYPGQFPWHVAVVNRDSGSPPDFDIVDLLGSGALISQRYVLTAASVVAAAAKAGAVDVVVGAAWLKVIKGGGKVVKAAGVTPHAQWNSATAENDIATVQLEKSVQKSDLIAPVRLPPTFYKGATYVGQTLSVSSWGYADQYNTQAFLSVYNFDVIRNRDCQDQQEDSSQVLPWTKLCAVAADYPNPCQQDVGDPAVFLEADGVPTLVGVVSGDTKCDTDAPARLTRVTELLDWIKANSDATIE